MALILAGPKAVPPPPAGPQWNGVTSMTWSVQGVGTYNLLDWQLDGVMVLRDGIRGLNMPPVERFTTSSPSVAGSRWRGYRTLERPVFWPTLVYTDQGTDAWHEADANLWQSLRPDLVGEWQIVTDRCGSRRLTCRWAGDSDHQFTRDPLSSGWAIYGIELVAEHPYWAGDWETAQWGGTAAGSSFLPGPPFTIGSSATVDAAEMENPGDLPAHVIWTINGPSTTAQVGFKHVDPWDGTETTSTVPVPFPIGEGERLVIDTRPHAQTAVLVHANGVETERTADLGAATSFAPIPPGDGVSLSLGLVGSGSIEAHLEPLFWRAF